jgi:3D (Asp-Asp-Asp) domain-containing protein
MAPKSTRHDARAPSGGQGLNGGGSSHSAKRPARGKRAPASSQQPAQPPPPGAAGKGKGGWLRNVTVTEYWPAPESWFVGKLVTAPGLPGKHRIDWLYSAQGISMEGDGIGLDGQPYHIASLGDGGWVTVDGKTTDPAQGFAQGAPYWRAGDYWLSAHRQLTFPLAAGGWSNGPGRKFVPLKGVTFAPGPSLPLTPYESIAVDPTVIPLGSLVYIPAYRDDGYGGWFVAQDTGGAIGGRHVDVYRTPPASPTDGGQYLTGEQIYVIKPAASSASRRA